MIISSIFCSLLGTGYVWAGDHPKTVVELFTSQGCSSCPPANEFVGELADDPDKLVLSFGVTYWDFLGWKDTFGQKSFTDRQRKYGETLEMGYVYTPQIVLNGTHHKSKYTKAQIEQSVLDAETAIAIDLIQDADTLVLSSSAPKTLIVIYRPGWQSIAVKEGENKGRTLKVANVVERIFEVEQAGTLDLELDEELAYAALVHDEQTNQIIAASVIRELTPWN